MLLVVAAGQEDVHQQFEERLDVFITRTVEEEGCSVYRELLRSPEWSPSTSNHLHLLLLLHLLSPFPGCTSRTPSTTARRESSRRWPCRG